MSEEDEKRIEGGAAKAIPFPVVLDAIIHWDHETRVQREAWVAGATAECEYWQAKLKDLEKKLQLAKDARCACELDLDDACDKLKERDELIEEEKGFEMNDAFDRGYKAALNFCLEKLETVEPPVTPE